ncbi:MAG: hypothetical protein COY39_04055 [Alphaproteobacteria bacterium CG_4_10_14_0_8_um_filter_37_21]|nr:MAG: hypothetical protein COY39_04055 [Alphaproteobacteria bacterium CG_4_10_14_0_8_um_filter_37_21]
MIKKNITDTYQLIKSETYLFVKKISTSEIYIFLKKKRSVKLSAFFIVISIIYTLIFGVDKAQHSTDTIKPQSSPFKISIFGDGIVECNTRNLSLGSFVPGIISEILVSEGNDVKKGSTLVRIDNKLLKHELLLDEAALKAVTVNYNEAEIQLKRSYSLKNVLSTQESQSRQFDYKRAVANLAVAEEKLSMTKTKLAQSEIVAPCDGKILKIFETVGSYVSNTSNIIMMGNTDPLHVRVQIDETDMENFNQYAKVFAVKRGVSDSLLPLKFVRFEPISQSKTILQGTSREIIDTRVIEVVYEMQSKENLYVGQRVDVYIENTLNGQGNCTQSEG